MANKKMTKREMFTIIGEILQGIDIREMTENRISGEEVDEFIAHEIELLDKKHGSISKADKAKAEADEVLKASILTLIKGKSMTASEIATALSTADTMIPNQKITAMLRQLSNAVTREVVKGKAYFSA